MAIAVDNDATLVHIGIKKEGGQYTLGVFPARSGETVAFYPNPKKGKQAPERPLEVVWVAHGIPDGMKILIRPKQGSPGKRLQDWYEIPNDMTPVPSGRIQTPPASSTTETWSYNVFLVGAAVPPNVDPVTYSASLDPDIIIHPDP
jgi:hypothetical protein